MSECLHCHEAIEGRSDKKFCTPYCKSAYHYQKNKMKSQTLFVQIDHQLKLNRRLLKRYNKAGKTTVRKSLLLSEGFNPKYFTHYWKANNGSLYLFCYEYGFMEKREERALKYVLVQWQAYMNE